MTFHGYVAVLIELYPMVLYSCTLGCKSLSAIRMQLARIDIRKFIRLVGAYSCGRGGSRANVGLILSAHICTQAPAVTDIQ